MSTPRSWRIGLVYDVLPLSLNDRRAWQVEARERRNLRDRVRMLARHLQIPRLDAIEVAMTWTPRTRRTRDRDNAVATLKPCIDGLRDYRARYRNVNGRRVLLTPAWVGVVADDSPEHVTYGMPEILPVNPDPRFTERLVLTITERTKA